MMVVKVLTQLLFSQTAPLKSWLIIGPIVLITIVIINFMYINIFGCYYGPLLYYYFFFTVDTVIRIASVLTVKLGLGCRPLPI